MSPTEPMWASQRSLIRMNWLIYRMFVDISFEFKYFNTSCWIHLRTFFMSTNRSNVFVVGFFRTNLPVVPDSGALCWSVPGPSVECAETQKRKESWWRVVGCRSKHKHGTTTMSQPIVTSPMFTKYNQTVTLRYLSQTMLKNIYSPASLSLVSSGVTATRAEGVRRCWTGQRIKWKRSGKGPFWK